MVFTYKLYKKCPELYEEKTLKYYKISQKNNMNNFPDMFFFFNRKTQYYKDVSVP